MFLTNLADVVRGAGLRTEEVPGWQSRGYAGQGLVDVRGILWHHTGTRSARDHASGAPTLGVCTNGHAGLAGPLCQLVLGRGGEVYVVAAGLANHAGQGAAPDVPLNEGNRYLIGIEMESSGEAPWDWSPEQLAAAPVLGAALERAYLLSRPAELRLQIGHLEYSSAGKIDPAGWPGGMDGLRASINAVLDGAQPAPAPATAPGPAPADAPQLTGAGIYPSGLSWTVERGDTLGRIAEHYGIPEKLGDICALNGITDPDVISEGQSIAIPGPLFWTVEPGDTLSKIARHYAMEPATVAANNGIGLDTPIHPGQVLRIAG